MTPQTRLTGLRFTLLILPNVEPTDARVFQTPQSGPCVRVAVFVALVASVGACEDLTSPVAPNEAQPEPLTEATMSGSSRPAAPGTFSITLEVDANFVKTHPLPVMAEPMMYQVEASGSVIDKRCTTVAPIVCTEPDFDAGGRWFGPDNIYGRTYISVSSPFNHSVITRSHSNPVGVVYARLVTLGGPGEVGRGGRDSQKCSSP